MNLNKGTFWPEEERSFRAKYSVGRTVLRVKKTSELVDPGPSCRAVFLDQAEAAGDIGGEISAGVWSFGTWELGGARNIAYGARIHHSDGTCLSFADGHVEYWRWSQPETIALGRYYADTEILGLDRQRPPLPKPDGPDYVRFFRAVWGKWPARLDGSTAH
jgi:prepilin-type processing-associated H-X9-DG protein